MVARELMLYTWGGMCAALITAAPGDRVKKWIEERRIEERRS